MKIISSVVIVLNFQSNNGYNIVLVSRSKTSTDPIKEEIDKVHKSVCVECINVDTTDESVVK